jgi:hypothetical protein
MHLNASYPDFEEFNFKKDIMAVHEYGNISDKALLEK